MARITTAGDVTAYGLPLTAGDIGTSIIVGYNDSNVPDADYSTTYLRYDLGTSNLIADLTQIVGKTDTQLHNESFKVFYDCARKPNKISLYTGHIGGDNGNKCHIIPFSSTGGALTMEAEEGDLIKNSERFELAGRAFHLDGSYLTTGREDLNGFRSGYAFPKNNFPQILGNEELDAGNIIRVQRDGFTGVSCIQFELNDFYIGHGAFACMNIKNQSGFTDVMNVNIYNNFLGYTHSEGIYLGYTGPDTSADSFTGEIYNNVIVATGTESLQLGHQSGLDTHNNTVYLATIDYDHAFLSGQSKAVQLQSRYGSSFFRKNIIVGGLTQNPDYEGVYLAAENGLRNVNDTFTFEDNIFSNSRQGTAYLGQNGAPPTVNLMPKVIYNRNYFQFIGEQGNENWWGDGTYIEKQGDNNYYVEATNNKLGTRNPNTLTLVNGSLANTSESGTTTFTDAELDFENVGLSVKGYSAFDARTWATLAFPLNAEGDSYETTPPFPVFPATGSPTGLTGVPTIDIADAATATWKFRINKYIAAGDKYVAGVECMVVADTGIRTDIGNPMAVFIPTVYFIATIATAVDVGDINNPYEETEITFNTPTTTVGTGSHKNWRIAQYQLNATRYPVEMIYNLNEMAIKKSKMYVSLINNNKYIDPIADVGANPVPDGNLETVGTNWKLIWFDNNGTPTTEIPVDVRLKSTSPYYSLGIGIEDISLPSEMTLSYNEEETIRTLFPIVNPSQPIENLSFVISSGSLPSGILLDGNSGQISGEAGIGTAGNYSATITVSGVGLVSTSKIVDFIIT